MTAEGFLLIALSVGFVAFAVLGGPEWLLRKFFPLEQPPSGTEHEDIETLRHKYALWYFVVFPIWVGIWAVVGAVIWLPLVGLASIWAAPLPEPALTPPPIAMAFAAAALALNPALKLGDVVFRRFLRSQWEGVNRLQELHHGIDWAKINRFLGRAMLSIGVLLTVLFLDTYVVLTDEGLSINRLLGLGPQTRPYSTIVDIRGANSVIAPIGTTTYWDCTNYIVEFDDGSVWETLYEPSDATCEELDSFIADLARRAHLHVRVLEVLTREDQRGGRERGAATCYRPEALSQDTLLFGIPSPISDDGHTTLLWLWFENDSLAGWIIDGTQNFHGAGVSLRETVHDQNPAFLSATYPSRDEDAEARLELLVSCDSLWGRIEYPWGPTDVRFERVHWD